MIYSTTLAELECYEWVALRTRENGAARIVRGARSQSKEDFLHEVAAALQLPPYFGLNWDAFEECVSDLPWLREDEKLTLVLLDADLALQNPADRRTFVSITEASEDAGWNRLEVVLQSSEAGPKGRWGSANFSIWVPGEFGSK